MARMLAALGVPQRSLILEDQSRDTMENCRNAAALLGGTGRVLVVTSDYHLRRAVMTGSARGASRADGLAAKTTGGRTGKRLTEACVTSSICCLAGRTKAGARPAWTYRLFARCSANRQKNEAQKKRKNETRRSELSIDIDRGGARGIIRTTEQRDFERSSGQGASPYRRYSPRAFGRFGETRSRQYSLDGRSDISFFS